MISKSVLFLFPPPQIIEGVGLGVKKDTGDLISIFGSDRRAPTPHLLQQKVQSMQVMESQFWVRLCSYSASRL